MAGITTRVTRHDRGSGRILGVYTRLGFRRWGVLAHHEFGEERSSATAARPRYAAYSQAFVAPYEWLVASMTLERLQSAAHDETRLRPEVQLRATDNLTVVVSVRNDLTHTRRGRPPRVYAIQLAVKGMQ